MLPISGKHPVAFTPVSYEEGDAKAPIYLIEVPTGRTRADFNRACIAAGLISHDRSAIVTVLREGVKGQIEEDQAGPLLDMLDRIEAASPEEPGDERDLDDYSILQADMRRHFPRFAAMIADNVHYHQMVPIIAAQVFLAGWEDVEARFRKRNGLVPEDVLAAIPEEDVEAIGIKALSLFAPSEEQAKNSGSRSPSRGGRGNSRAARKPRKVTPGRSSASATSETPPIASAPMNG